MATLAELKSLVAGETDDGGLRGKVLAAAGKKANAVVEASTPSAGLVAWAKETLMNPANKVDELLNAAVFANADQSIATIVGATDSAIESAVNAAVDALYDA